MRMAVDMAVKTAYKFCASRFSPIFFPDMVFLERTPRAAEETLESIAEARARKVKDNSFIEAMATPPMMGSNVRYTGRANVCPNRRALNRHVTTGSDALTM
eukprot:Lithocolla_globosa_v1_NODE_4700_length_1383_cov_16.280120.p3 type:complete len:101 gc:universal NODE_4700_length_1383_cov_16.280120:448-750(+)